jgi:transposase
MMGRLNRDQGQFLYCFNLEEVVPEDHSVRAIAGVLDLSWVYAELAPYYSRFGRPSIDPALMIRMLIVGYVFGIRSERALCRDVRVNLAYRWFCGLNLEDNIPDHSAFSRARNERFRDGDVFRRVFVRVVSACMAAGLVGGEGFAVDASLIEADANKSRSVAGAEWNARNIDPQAASRAAKDYLATLEDAAYGAASSVIPKFVSRSDPAAQWTGAMKTAAFFAYADNYLIDVKFGIIMDVEASRAIRQAEVGASRTMIERTEATFGIKPQWLAADTAYGSAANLDWLVNEQKVAPYIPVIDKSQRDDGTFSREEFIFDKDRNIYICPANKALTTTGRLYPDHKFRYRASVPGCRACPLKLSCCPKAPARRIDRDVNEEARDVARALAKTRAYAQSRHDRKKVEMLFAHLKRILGLVRLRLRGPSGAQFEFTLAAIAQNLRRLAKLMTRARPENLAACLA